MKNPKRIDRKTLYKSDWIHLHLDKVKMPEGRIIDPYHVLDFKKESVGVLVENREGQLLLVEAYRYVTQSLGWEIPAGVIQSGESPVEAARREVREESGYKISNCKLLYRYCPSIGISNQVFHIVACTAEKGSGRFDASEVKQFSWFSINRIEDLVRKNAITDGLTLTGLLFWFHAGLIPESDE